METKETIGWKTYTVAVIAIIAGLVAFAKGNWSDGVKGVIGGCALISLRDAVAKILRAIEANRRAVSNLRAAIDVYLTRRP